MKGHPGLEAPVSAATPEGALPLVALSIKQPWAWLIVHGHKDIENRSWRTRVRGPVLIHSSLKADQEASNELLHGRHPVTGEPAPELAVAYITACRAGRVHLGGVVGVAEITGCNDCSDSDWFVGPFGFSLAKARPLPFQPCKGKLSFFAPDLPANTPTSSDGAGHGTASGSDGSLQARDEPIRQAAEKAREQGA